MIHGGQITTTNLHNFPIKLAKDVIGLLQLYESQDYAITIIETIPRINGVYFLASHGGTHTIVASIHGLMYTKLNSRISYFFSSIKTKTYNYLTYFDVLTPAFCTDKDDYQKMLTDFGKVVVKPREGTKGEGVIMDITTSERLAQAVELTTQKGEQAIIQQQIEGDDYRLLFIGGKFFAAIRRDPAYVEGDGVSTVEQLVAQYNQDKQKRMPAFAVDLGVINAQNIRSQFGDEFMQKIPAKGETCKLASQANISLGGRANDVTETVNPALIAKLEPIVQMLGMDLCGIDIISTDITTDPSAKQSYVIEINASPGLVPHAYPDTGKAYDPFPLVLELLENRENTIAKIEKPGII